MGTVRVMNTDAQFNSEIAASGSKLVVVNCTAEWCGPCRAMAPVVEKLSGRYPMVIFLQVDVDKCQGTAQAQDISKLPTVIFFRNGTKLDKLEGLNPTTLESKIKQYSA